MSPRNTRKGTPRRRESRAGTGPRATDRERAVKVDEILAEAGGHVLSGDNLPYIVKDSEVSLDQKVMDHVERLKGEWIDEHRTRHAAEAEETRRREDPVFVPVPADVDDRLGPGTYRDIREIREQSRKAVEAIHVNGDTITVQPGAVPVLDKMLAERGHAYVERALETGAIFLEIGHVFYRGTNRSTLPMRIRWYRDEATDKIHITHIDGVSPTGESHINIRPLEDPLFLGEPSDNDVTSFKYLSKESE